MSTSITIGDTTIHQDEHGRFCLNDLHRAAGGEPRHQPGLFLRLDKTDEMVALLRSTDPQIEPLVVLKGGVLQGTFVVKDLVYDYAMWISPAFRLRVIRAFDAMATQANAQRAIMAEYADGVRHRLRSNEAIIAFLEKHRIPYELIADPVRDARLDLEAHKRMKAAALNRRKQVVRSLGAGRSFL